MLNAITDFKRRRTDGSVGNPTGGQTATSVFAKSKKEVTGRNGILLKLTDVTTSELSALQKRLTFYPIQLYDKKALVAPVLGYLLDANFISLPRNFGMSVYPNVKEDFSVGESLSNLSFTGTLRPLQDEVVQTSLKKLNERPYGIILSLPCGYGKTVIGLAVAAKLGRRCLVVVHKSFLLSQWRDRIASFFPDASVGIIQGKLDETEMDFSIAMVQTITSREYPQGFFDKFGTVILDEVHHYASKTFSSFFFKNRIKFIIGLSATPKRKDNLTSLLHYYVGDLAVNIDESTTSSSRPCRILRYRYLTSNPITSDLTPAAVQKLKGKLVCDSARTTLIIDFITNLAQTGRKIIVLSERVAHLEKMFELAKALQSHDVSLYIGSTKPQDRLKASAAQIIFATFSLASEGLDIATLDTLILATPFSDVQQAVGRILRHCEFKRPPLVLDILDNTCSQFERMSNSRLSLYKRNRYEVLDVASTSDILHLT